MKVTLRKLTIITFTMALIIGLVIANSTISKKQETFSGRILELGNSGDDVIELQERLKYIGYLKGETDGKFGWNTYWALRKFQKDFGMKVDGKAGKDTQRVLVAKTKYERNQKAPATAKVESKQSSSGYKAHGLSANDLKILANAVYGESRGEPYVGQVAVAAVILNRVDNPSFPNTPSGVVFEPRAFTAVADGQIWLTPNETAKKAVQDALNGMDPTGGCIYYFNPETATSPWIWGRPQVKKIGKHIFCK